MQAINSKQRESSFELLRIIAQFMIILYHILLVGIYPATGEAFYKALFLPIHIGVPLFILISGYFGIRASVKGLVKLLGMVFVLQIPHWILEYQAGSFAITKVFMFMSWTPFWFMRTYLFLYLLSPVINKFLKNITIVERIFLLLALFYISDVVGFTNADFTLKAGKNIVTFMMYYTIGDTLREYKHILGGRKLIWYVLTFLVVNVALVCLFTLVGFENQRIEDVFYRVFIDYNSIFMLVNSVLFFVIIGKLQIQSTLINSIAKASMAMYILHGTFINVAIVPIALKVLEYNTHPFVVTCTMIGIAILVVLICALVYWLLTPVWNGINRVGGYCQSLIDKKISSNRT